jgi:large subunit ribosomal protein L12
LSGCDCNMEYVYAALMLHKLKQPVSEDNVKKVISAAGAQPDEIRVKALVSALGEVNIDEALKNAAAAPMMAAAPAAGGAAPAEAKPAEEEKKEEKKEQEALEGLSSLFG